MYFGEDLVKIVRTVTVLWFAFICAFTLHTASAQSDSVQCGTFSNDQAAAQEYFEANGQPDFLDGDGDGLACASPEDGDYSGKPTAGPSGPSAGPSGPSAGPGDVICGSFSNDQEAAQEYFEANGHPYNLDLDGDGQACASPEDGDYTGGPSAGPEDESESESAIPVAESDDTVIQALPVTGAGPQPAVGHSNGLGVLLSMSLIVGVGAFSAKRLFRG